MDATLTREELEHRLGDGVISADGERIGKLEEVYVDETTGRPEWVAVGTGFFSRNRLVPVGGATLTRGGLTLPYSKDVVKHAPDVDGSTITPDEERALREHYGHSAATA
jgi:uncharacterized protein YrrD